MPIPLQTKLSIFEAQVLLELTFFRPGIGNTLGGFALH
jgi:hypothetical protein